MRTLLLLALATLASPGCALLETPCGRVAGSICTIPGEESACQALRSYGRGDERAQKICEKVEPSAFEYAKAPDSTLRRLQWKAQRAVLAGAGVLDSVTGNDPGEKLDRAARKGQKAANKAADDLADAVDDMIEVIVED